MYEYSSPIHGSVIFVVSSFAYRNNEANREFKKTTTATGTSLNKRFNEQNNGCARALYL